MKAYTKDVLKTILKEKKRFLAIMMITALGVCMLAGLKAACDDLRFTADKFFDEQNLMDIKIISTMGLTDEDVDALSSIPGVEDAEGSYSETVYTTYQGIKKQAEVNTLSDKGINMPYLLEGEMPLRADEILVTQKYMEETGHKLGETLVIEEDLEEESEEEEEAEKETGEKGSEQDSTEEDSEDDEDLKIEIEEEMEEPNFLVTEYKIVGVIIDALDINSSAGAVSFRANSNTDYTFYVLPEAIDSEVYTAVYMTLYGTDELMCYSDAYEKKVDSIVQILEEQVKEDREQHRYDKVTGDAWDKIDDAEGEMKDKFTEAEEKIQDAIKELEDAKQELLNGEKDLKEAEREVAKAERELQKAQRELERAERELAAAKTELDAAWDELEAGEALLEEGEQALVDAEQTLDESEKSLNEAEAEIPDQFESVRVLVEGQLLDLKVNISDREAEIKKLEKDIETLKADIEALEAEEKSLQEEIAAIEAKLEEGSLSLLEQTQLNTELNTLKVELLSAQTELNTKRAELSAAEASLSLRQEQVESYKQQQKTYEDTLSDLDKQEQEAYEEIANGRKEIEEGRKEIEENKLELEKNKKELADGRKELEEAQLDYDTGKKEVEDGWKQLEDGWDELEDARDEIEEAKEEIENGRGEIAEGESELEVNVSEYNDKKNEAEDLLADAKEELKDLKMTEWYISTRTANAGYNTVKTDAQCIEAIGNAFPILFLTIAILVSLTTISRMVEEDRGLIGTYKALGFTNKEIQSKYLIYALLACFCGGILGDILGFIVLPKIIFVIFGVMYQFTDYIIGFNVLYGVGGIILFIIAIGGSAILSCSSELSRMPATLMRPKAPKNGSRVLLERVTPVWSRLSFLNKVTVRNLFRYKKRLFMTLFGIAGCTALLIAGFTIKDTVTELMYKQYGGAYVYDAMLVAEDNDKLTEYLEEDKDIRSYINPMITNVKLINEAGKEESLQLIVLPEGVTLRGYINLYDENDVTVPLADGDVLVTINACNLLGVKSGEMVSIQTMQLDMAEVELTDIVMNYMGNSIYMTQNTYEELFGEFEANGAFVRLNSDKEKHKAWGEAFEEKDGILTVSIAAGIEDIAETVFRIINLVVYVVIVLAAALAFVVLFTLATTNISERERELATIKVLGFFNKEVHLYVNKETMILTSLGILLGLPAGKWLGEWLMSVLNMPSIYFDPSLYPISYVYSAALAILFAFIVNFITDRSLDKINPVEALKSIE